MSQWLITSRGLATWLWSILFTPVYSLVCMSVLLFSRKTGYAIGRLWCQQLLSISGVRCQVVGLDKIQAKEKYILVCNHQSNLDISVLMVNLPLYLVFIAKKELFQLPFFGWGIKALGHIAIDRSHPRIARESIMLASNKIKKEKTLSLVVFPEGTRSPDGQIHDFKQGSFNLALETKLPIVPVAIKGTYNALPKKRFLARPAKVKLIIGDIIDPKTFTKSKLAQVTQFQIQELMSQA